MPLDLAPDPVATEASEGSSLPRVLLLKPTSWSASPRSHLSSQLGRGDTSLLRLGSCGARIGIGGTGWVCAAQLSTRTRECPGTPPGWMQGWPPGTLTRMDAGLASGNPHQDGCGAGLWEPPPQDGCGAGLREPPPQDGCGAGPSSRCFACAHGVTLQEAPSKHSCALLCRILFKIEWLL